MAKPIRLDVAADTNKVWAVGRGTVDRLIVGANPGSPVTINLYNYDHVSGNIPSGINVDYQVLTLVVGTSGAPNSVELGFNFDRGLTIRSSTVVVATIIVS